MRPGGLGPPTQALALGPGRAGNTGRGRVRGGGMAAETRYGGLSAWLAGLRPAAGCRVQTTTTKDSRLWLAWAPTARRWAPMLHAACKRACSALRAGKGRRLAGVPACMHACMHACGTCAPPTTHTPPPHRHSVTRLVPCVFRACVRRSRTTPSRCTLSTCGTSSTSMTTSSRYPRGRGGGDMHDGSGKGRRGGGGRGVAARPMHMRL